MNKILVIGGFCKDGLSYIESLKGNSEIIVVDNLQESTSLSNFTEMQMIPFQFNLLTLDQLNDLAGCFKGVDQIEVFVDRYTKYEESPSLWLADFTSFMDSLIYHIILSKLDRDKVKITLNGTFAGELSILLGAILAFYQENYEINFELNANFL